MSVDIIDMDALNVAIKVVKDTAAKSETIEEKCKRALSVINRLDDATEALTGAMLRWDSQISENELSYTNFPPVIIDFIDDQIEAGKVSNAQDIISLFEKGELKGIVVNNAIDKDALAKFQKKNGKGKILGVEDEVF
jgi:hypothetical protein